MARILVLGGTAWLGSVVAAQSLSRGHEVVCLARGEAGSVPAGARLVQADRSDPQCYSALPHSGSWDVVVDVARHPGHVRGALAALCDRASNWVFVSSCSVYARHDEPGADESAALLPPLVDDVAAPEQYGEAKSACEAAVRRVRGDAALIARSGLIVGWGDPSDRFGYWPGRFAQAVRDGGPVLVPEHCDAPVQWVDVEDLSSWLVTAGLAGTVGSFNAVGRAVPLQQVLDAAARAAGFTGERVVAAQDALVEASVEEFMGPRSLPLWLHDPAYRAFLDRSSSAAAGAGLRVRPLDDTTAAALAWEASLGTDRHRELAGLDRADELELIGALRQPA